VFVFFKRWMVDNIQNVSDPNKNRPPFISAQQYDDGLSLSVTEIRQLNSD